MVPCLLLWLTLLSTLAQQYQAQTKSWAGTNPYKTPTDSYNISPPDTHKKSEDANSLSQSWKSSKISRNTWKSQIILKILLIWEIRGKKNLTSEVRGALLSYVFYVLFPMTDVLGKRSNKTSQKWLTVALMDFLFLTFCLCCF